MALNPVIYAVAAGCSVALWLIFHKLAAPSLPQIMGAILVSVIAVCFGSVLLMTDTSELKSLNIPLSALILLVLAGAGAFGADYFTLRAFSSGLPISIGAPIIYGLSAALPPLFGLVFLREEIDLIKIFSICLVVLGCVLLGMRGS